MHGNGVVWSTGGVIDLEDAPATGASLMLPSVEGRRRFDSGMFLADTQHSNPRKQAVQPLQVVPALRNRPGYLKP